MGRKCAQATGMTASLRILLSKADSNTWERFTRSELKLESVHQESPRSDVFSKRATKPLLKEKDHQKHLTWAKEKNNYTVAQWSKVLFSDESKFCLSESGGRVERHRITLLEVQCEVSTVSDDLGCHAICWCWSTLFSEVHSQQSHCKPCASMSPPPPPSRGQKALLKSTGTISCICNSSIQDATHQVVHTLY